MAIAEHDNGQNADDNINPRFDLQPVVGEAEIDLVPPDDTVPAQNVEPDATRRDICEKLRPARLSERQEAPRCRRSNSR
ncbi:hypothetical protein DF3PB_650013 [uncultured Defluviicoccus sp.]|uniref:Uncharacterized protein n=1 Tax=metagenome TaxID=256318 RepID=A0A380TIV7_9ZZZZ|nr:hypothetical protein DF3PB_650013 [uncultured Defluviicoccus sp.]